DGCGQNGVHLIGGVDSPTAEADSGQSRDLRGVAADRGRSVGGGAADAGGAEVDRADADRVEDPGLAGGSGDVDGGIGGEQLVVRGGAEVDEHAVGDAGELPGVGLMVEHRRGGTDGQEHVRTELLHEVFVMHWMSGCPARSRALAERRSKSTMTIPSLVWPRSGSMGVLSASALPVAADRHEAPHVIGFDCISPTGTGRVRTWRPVRYPRPTYLWPRRLSASTTTAVSRTSAVMICCASELKPMR